MQADPLQQLRDIHLPPEPGWWPPAPGWWLLTLLALAALGYLLLKAHEALLRRRPLREARRLYALLYADYCKGLVEPALYLHRANELLKRLVIHGLHMDEARRANDADWLTLLDRLSGGNAFTCGPGAQLGNQRFASEPRAEVDALHPVLEQLLARVRP
jgi:hypothetical protein